MVYPDLRNPVATVFRMSHSRSARERGFTVIELIVVTGIFVIVTAIVLASNNRFGGRILLQNLAYDIALTVRQAQVYGISVRQFAGGNFSAGYAMYFGGSPTTYVLFADAGTPDGLFNAAESETVESTEIARGYFISKLCAPAGIDTDCTQGTAVNRLDILFKRPEPDACISAGGVSAINEDGSCAGGKESGRIVVESPRGDKMSIVVEATGQISIQ